MTNTPSTPPGWYPDPEAANSERYWDGAAWTEHRRPVAAAPAPPPAPPYGGAAAGVPGAPAGAKPDNYLVWTILSTILCCLPIGAVGIYFSTQVDKLWAQGDVVGAENRSRNARNLAITSAVVSLVLFLVWVVFIGVFGQWNFQVNS